MLLPTKILSYENLTIGLLEIEIKSISFQIKRKYTPSTKRKLPCCYKFFGIQIFANFREIRRNKYP